MERKAVTPQVTLANKKEKKPSRRTYTMQPRPTGLASSTSQHTLEWYFVEQGYTPARHGHSAVPYGDCIYVFGGDGKDNRRLNAIHKFDVDTLLWTKIPATGGHPEPRSGHSAVVWRDMMIIFGGRDGRNHFGDLYALRFRDASWHKIETTGTLVKRRYRHSAVMYGDCMYVFGGEQGGESTTEFPDFYEFDMVHKSWREVQAVGDKPSARSGHSAVVYRHSMYIFGGRNKTPQYFRDLYRYEFVSKTWYLITTQGVSPPRTYNHSAFTYRDSLYVFGGYGIEGTQKKGAAIGHRHSELFEYSMEQNEWSLVKVTGTPPSARLGHTTAVIKSTLYLFGGWDRNGYRSDLYCINFDDVMLDMKKLLLDTRSADIEFEVQNDAGGVTSIFAHSAVVAVRCPKLMEIVKEEEDSSASCLSSSLSGKEGQDENGDEAGKGNETEKENEIDEKCDSKDFLRVEKAMETPKEKEKEKKRKSASDIEREKEKKRRRPVNEKERKSGKEKEREKERDKEKGKEKEREKEKDSDSDSKEKGKAILQAPHEDELSIYADLDAGSDLPGNHIVVHLKDMRASVLKQVLEFIYTDTMTYNPDVGKSRLMR